METNSLIEDVLVAGTSLGEALLAALAIHRTAGEDAAYSVAVGVMSAANGLPGVDEIARREAVLDAVAVLAGLREGVDTVLHGRVESARASGASWEEVGQALGISRQAAQQRYGRGL